MIKKSIQEVIKNIIKDFSLFENWEERYEYLIDFGKKLSKFPKNLRVEGNLIGGCQSQVWLYAYKKKNKIFFQADSDAIIPRGIIALMLYIYSGRFPDEIINSDFIFLSKIEFNSFLSPIRSNSIKSIFNRIKKYAIILKSSS